jgi:microcystin-dependent protein
VTFREGEEGGSGNDYSDLRGGSDRSKSFTSTATGGVEAHNNMPPYYCLHFIIKAE